jgi:hypothetical protein
MRTEELMREYQQGSMPMPDSGWQKLVYLAAELLKTAKQMRNTLRTKREKRPAPYTQTELLLKEDNNVV